MRKFILMSMCLLCLCVFAAGCGNKEIKPQSFIIDGNGITVKKDGVIFKSDGESMSLEFELKKPEPEPEPEEPLTGVTFTDHRIINTVN